MVSSSSSHAASAMAKSLVAKGADFVSSMTFMIASTNLVVELGNVILVLLGWQFAVAEFVGGPIVIILLALTGGLVFTPTLLAAVRKRLGGDSHGGHDHAAMAGVSESHQEELEGEPRGTKLWSLAGWSDASSYAVAHVTMLRRELVVGYAVAGLLAVLVPIHVWNALFLQGHGFWTTLENALVGPIIAVLSCVCSIGNAPLAAALWSGGISFGGVIAFIFADLIAMPLILNYRKFYGWKLTARLVGLFYVLMVIAALVTELIFRAFGAVPVNRVVGTEPAHVGWNYTTYLNLIFLAVAGVVWWLARNTARFGGGDGYAIDPVCGMQVRKEHAPAQFVRDGTTFYFCADRCRDRFESDPGRYDRVRAVPEGTGEVTAGMPAPPVDGAMGQRRALATVVVDPVCGMAVDPATAAAHRSRDGVDIWFCGTDCAERFDGQSSS